MTIEVSKNFYNVTCSLEFSIAASKITIQDEFHKTRHKAPFCTHCDSRVRDYHHRPISAVLRAICCVPVEAFKIIKLVKRALVNLQQVHDPFKLFVPAQPLNFVPGLFLKCGKDLQSVRKRLGVIPKVLDRVDFESWS